MSTPVLTISDVPVARSVYQCFSKRIEFFSYVVRGSPRLRFKTSERSWEKLSKARPRACDFDIRFKNLETLLVWREVWFFQWSPNPQIFVFLEETEPMAKRGEYIKDYDFEFHYHLEKGT